MSVSTGAQVKSYRALAVVLCLICGAAGSAQAAVVVANSDSFSIPTNRYLFQEAAGVLDNDTLDGENATDGGVTVTLVTGVTKGILNCPDNGALDLCPDGSFEYTPGSSFDGLDRFQYRARALSGETATATVTLSACSGGPGVYTCWHEGAYLARLTELGGYNLFREGFESSAWDGVRSSGGSNPTMPSIVSKGITWTTNFPDTNGITTGSGAARSGQWGAYDPDHGSASGTTNACDVDTPPLQCHPNDGLSGSGTALFAVGGHVSAVVAGGSISVVLDGGAAVGLGPQIGSVHQFFGIIDTAGFSTFRFAETNGKIGQELPVFADDFIVATTSEVGANSAPVLASIGNRSIDENGFLSFDLGASDADDGDILVFSVNNLPSGADFFNNGDGTATFEWQPGFNQSGVYTVDFTLTDNGFPVASDNESITITVNDVNRAPRLSAIGDRSVNDGDLLSFLLTANDADGHSLVFSVTGGGPTGSSLVNNGNNTANFSWTPEFSQVGDHLVNFVVTDNGSPPASDSEVITISVTTPDVTPPVITLVGITPVNIELGNGYIELGATAFDNIDGDISSSIQITGNLNLGAVGNYSITYTVSDVAGNPAAPVVRNVNVTPDVTVPVVTAPGNITVAATNINGTSASVAAIANFLGAATATDTVDGPRTVTNDAPLVFPLGPTTVTFSATDGSSNLGQATATVRIEDQEPPVITLLDPISMTLSVGDIFIDPGSTVADNVDVGIRATVTGSVNTAAVGIYTLAYNASDAAGNVALEQTRSVSVQDAVAPVVTPPLNITVAATDATGTTAIDPTIAAFLAGATATDDVDTTLTITHDAPAQFPLNVTTTVAFSATDSANNTGSATATVRVVDLNAPTILLTGGAVTLSVGEAYVEPGVSASDNVDGNLTAAIVVAGDLNVNAVGSYTVTYNVSDVAGNVALEQTRSVSVQDAVAPVVTPPGNITVAATDATGTTAIDPTIAAFLAGATATDDVDTTLTITHDAPAQFPLNVTTTVTFSATDSANNTGSATATVRVVDLNAPTILLTGGAVTLNVGEAFVEPGVSASDNVDGNLTAAIVVAGDLNVNAVGSYTVTYNVSDVAGNVALEQTRSVSVQDAVAPVVTPPGNITVAATDATGTAAIDPTIAAFLAGATATDDVDTTLTITHDAPAQFPLNVTTTVTFSATDSANNTGSATATVRVEDQMPPLITLTGGAVTLNVGEAYFEPGVSASDNVDGNLTAAIVVAGDLNVNAVGSYTVTYNVSDVAGNAALEVMRSVSVQDDAAPVVTAPSNITVAATDASGTEATNTAIANFLAAATATDLVDGAITLITNDAPLQFPLGPTTVTFGARDSSNNLGQATATVTIADQDPPVITLNTPLAMTLLVGDLFTDPGSRVTDNVDVGLSATVTGSVNTAAVGIYTLFYNVSDAAGNPALQVTRSVSVQDIDAPVVSAPASITVAATNINGTSASVTPIAAFLGAATATDVVDGPITVITNDAPAVFPLGPTTVTFGARDSSNNLGQATATVTIADQDPPVITLNTPLAMTLLVGDLFTDPGSRVTDNVDVGLSATVTGSVNTAAVGIYTLFYNVSDAAGNPALQVTRSVSVQDAVAPVVTPPLNITVAATDGSGTLATYIEIVNFLNGATGIDAVDGPLPVTHDAPDSFPLNVTTTVTFSATDSANNTGSATATVRVVDLNAPTILLTGGAVTLNVGEAYVEPGVSASDNVDGNLTAAIVVAGNLNVNAAGSYTVTYNVSDVAGNAAIEVMRSVSVQDGAAPVVTAPSNITVAATDASGTEATNTAIAAFLGAATATDVVDGPITVITNDAPAVFPLGPTTVTFGARDSSNNLGQATATVTIADQDPPVITLNTPLAMTLLVGDLFTDPGSRVTDNVDVGLSATVTGSVNTAAVGIYTLFYNVSDAAGNPALQVTRSVSVQDAVAPVVTPPLNITVAATDGSGTLATYIEIVNFLNGATGIDAVDGPLPVTHDAPDSFPLNVTTTVTFSATDSANNTGSATATVRVVDLNAPTILLTGGAVTLNVGEAYVEPGVSASDNVDGNLTAAIVVAGNLNVNAVGSYTVTYNVSDVAGNAAIEVMRSVSVQDGAAPVVTAPSNITVAATDASGTEATNTAIAAFLAAATATDAVDGPITTIDNDAPSMLPLGTTTVTFSATDSNGNTGRSQATVTVTMTDQTPPVITLQGLATINSELCDVYVDPGATANDNVDGDLSDRLVVTSTVDISKVGSYSVTYNVADAAGNEATSLVRTVNVTPDVTPPVITLLGDSPLNVVLGDSYVDAGATVADNASIINSSSIAVTNNVDTRQLGSYSVIYNVSDPYGNAALPVTRIVKVTATPNLPPVVTAPADILVNAQGAVTSVDTGTATAVDDIDGAITASPDNSGSFVPGHHQVLWSATDSSGYTGYAIQFVDVQPLVEFQTGQSTAPGTSVKVRVLLNGNAATYPVEVNYDVFEGNNLTPIDSGVVVITAGIEGSFDYAIPGGILTGDIRFVITSVTGAEMGPMDTHLINVGGDNHTPLVQLEIRQGGILTDIVATNGGPVSVKVIITDSDPADSHVFDWSATDNALLASSPGLFDDNFLIDPSGLSAGFNKISARVTDNGVPNLSTEIERYLQVITTAPILGAIDTDGDDIDDDVEGYGDSDGDGIPDYLDGIANPALLQALPGVFDMWFMNVQPGLTLRLGKIAQMAGLHTPAIDAGDLSRILGSLGGVLPASTTDNSVNTGGYFDFEIHGLTQPGQSALLVIPQFAPIPANAVYRKYTETGGWVDFIENANNGLWSTPGAAGVCPAPGDAIYVPGLNAGHHCVQMLIEDGGANDGDASANGVIADPGGVAIPQSQSTTTNVTSGSSGSSGGGSSDVWMLLIMLGLFKLRFGIRYKVL